MQSSNPIDPSAGGRSSSRRRFLRAGAMSVGSLVVLTATGCGLVPGTAPAGQTSSAARPAAESATRAPRITGVTKIKIGVPGAVFENAYTQLGVQKGYYREHGIDPEWVELPDGNAIIKGMLAGELDAGETGAAGVLTAFAAGAPLRLVGAVRPKLNFVLYAKRDIAKPEDMLGKSVGAAAPGTLLNQLVTTWLKQVKVDSSKVNFVNIGTSAAVFQAVVAGKVDAGPATIDFLPALQPNGDVKAYVNFWEVLPNYLRICLAVKDRDLKDRPEVVEGLMTGLARSIRYGVEHGDEIVKFSVEKWNKKPDDTRFGHDFEVKNRIVAPDLDFNDRQIDYMQRLNVEAGDQKEIFPFERIATLDLQRRVVESLGKYDWK